MCQYPRLLLGNGRLPGVELSVVSDASANSVPSAFVTLEDYQ